VEGYRRDFFVFVFISDGIIETEFFGGIFGGGI
jgi:hypothetical protein